MTSLLTPTRPFVTADHTTAIAAAALEIITDPAAVAAWHDAWRNLVRERGITWPTGHPHRFDAVLAAAGRDAAPHLVVVRRGAAVTSLVAGWSRSRRLPLRLGYWRLRGPRLRCLEVVHGGVIGADDPEDVAALAPRLLDEVTGGTIDLLALHQVPAEHPLLAAIASEAAARGLAFHDRPHAHGALALVPGSYEATLAARLSKKRRNQVRREQRVLARAFDGEVEFIEQRRPEEVEQILARAQEISTQTYKRRLGLAVTDEGPWRAVLESAAARGSLRAWFLLARGRPIAFALGEVIGDRFYLETMGFVPAHASLSPGKNVLFRGIERLCAEHVQWLDYGIGDARYKRVFGSHWDQRITRRVFGPGPRARLARVLAATTESAHDLAARIARRTGMGNGLRAAWRRRLQQTTNGEHQP